MFRPFDIVAMLAAVAIGIGLGHLVSRTAIAPKSVGNSQPAIVVPPPPTQSQEWRDP